MAIVDSNTDPDIMRVLSVLTEMSEHLSQNRTMALSVHSLASNVKTQLVHSQTGFVLRRFNMDKPQELYDAELERMNSAMSAENHALQNDNRQLNTLIREYEQTLENVMSSFRTRAHEVQQHELSLMRHYESIIIERETESLAASLAAGNARSESLARIGRLLREVMRKLGGEDAQKAEAAAALVEESLPIASSSRSTSGSEQTPPTPSEAGESKDESGEEDGLGALEDEDPEKRLAAAEWALERESELARLEKENEELRMLLNGVLNTSLASASAQAASSAPPGARSDMASDGSIGSDLRSDTSRSSSPFSSRPSQLRPGVMGGLTGTVGPYGTLKKARGP